MPGRGCGERLRTGEAESKPRDLGDDCGYRVASSEAEPELQGLKPLSLGGWDVAVETAIHKPYLMGVLGKRG